MYIKTFSYLNKIYKKIIINYQKKKLHHAIIVESYYLYDIYWLIYCISKWILCHNKLNIYACETCTSCILIKKKNHPDFYIFHPNKLDKICDIEKLRKIIISIQNTPQQNQNKILWIPNYHTLTLFSINTLLKILEEPPKNTFFFIGNIIGNTLHPTFRSRLLLHRIPIVTEKFILNWIKKKKIYNQKKFFIEFRINNHDFHATIQSIKKKMWVKRKFLYQTIHSLINQKNFLKLLPILNNKECIIQLNWIILLFLDSLKKKSNIFYTIINIDYIDLIHKINQTYSYFYISKILDIWIKCRYQIFTIKNINQELLILKNLLKWNIFHNK
ncbi:DNA polymerase III subunit delta' C-terminal domain-containing protein [Buchnera aphidicola]|uniref:DNA polymerase III subunit delta' C-terminal domain-containing protein n=1 Tax=Buchnera aphidicola TaxID=9 RepID=UPI0031B889A7